jgi:hypothetical protein
MENLNLNLVQKVVRLESLKLLLRLHQIKMLQNQSFMLLIVEIHVSKFLQLKENFYDNGVVMEERKVNLVFLKVFS